jgi:predicted dehydrogenase
VTVVGSRKMAVCNDLVTEEKIRFHDKGVSSPIEGDDLTQPPMSYRYGDITVPFLPAGEPLAIQDEHFVECITSGTPARTDGYSGLAVVEVLEAAQASLQSGHPTHLDASEHVLAALPCGSGPAWSGRRRPTPRCTRTRDPPC